MDLQGKMHDSGERQQFETGAVRDTSTGKGRFDLISMEGLKRTAQYINKHIGTYSTKTKEDYLNEAFYCYVEYMSGNKSDDYIAGVSANMLNYIQLVETGSPMRVNEYSANNCIGRYDLMSPKGLMRLAKWGELGACKYSRTYSTTKNDLLETIKSEVFKCQDVLNVTVRFIAKDYAGVVMKKVYEQEIQSLFKDKEIMQINGEQNIQSGLKMRLEREEKTLVVEKEIEKQREKAILEKEVLRKKVTTYCYNGKIIPAQFAEELLLQSELSILTMTILQEKQEDFFVVVAITDLECLKNLLELCRKQFDISKTLQRQISSSQTKNDVIEVFVTGDRNWEKGMPISRCVDSGMRHLTKILDGWVDEDHPAAVVWNAFAVMHFEKYMPEMQDLPNLISK